MRTPTPQYKVVERKTKKILCEGSYNQCEVYKLRNKLGTDHSIQAISNIKKYTDKTIWQNGVHKGKALANIPDGWFKFMWENGCKVQGTPDIRLQTYIKENANVFKIII